MVQAHNGELLFGVNVAYDIFCVIVVVAVCILIILLLMSLVFSVSRRSWLLTVYFTIMIALEALRVFGRLWDIGSTIAFSLFPPQRNVLFNINTIVEVMIDDMINAFLVGGFLVITHRWVGACVRIVYQRENKFLQILPSILLFTYVIAVQATSIVVSLFIFFFSLFRDFENADFMISVIHNAAHSFLYFSISAVIIGVGVILARLLRQVYFEGKLDNSSFVRGTTKQLREHAQRVTIVSLSTAVFFFVGGWLMLFNVIGFLYPFIVSLLVDPNGFIAFVYDYVDEVTVYLTVIYLTCYIFIFEFGLTGFIMAYCIFKPDVGITELPPLSQMREYQNLYDYYRVPSGEDNDDKAFSKIEEDFLDQVEDVGVYPIN